MARDDWWTGTECDQLKPLYLKHNGDWNAISRDLVTDVVDSRTPRACRDKFRELGYQKDVSASTAKSKSPSGDSQSQKSSRSGASTSKSKKSAAAPRTPSKRKAAILTLDSESDDGDDVEVVASTSDNRSLKKRVRTLELEKIETAQAAAARAEQREDRLAATLDKVMGTLNAAVEKISPNVVKREGDSSGDEKKPGEVKIG